jgi:hypothetical protein
MDGWTFALAGGGGSAALGSAAGEPRCLRSWGRWARAVAVRPRSWPCARGGMSRRAWTPAHAQRGAGPVRLGALVGRSARGAPRGVAGKCGRNERPRRRCSGG